MVLFELLQLTRVFLDYLRIEYLWHIFIMPLTNRNGICSLRSSCMRARPGKGRLVMIHPQEALLQEARAFQKSEAFAPYRKLRQAAEHRLARLMQLGVRQARYF